MPLIHVVKPREAKQRNSFGVAFDLLAIGPQSMVTKMHYLKENVIPFHSHPNEQTGYILSGRIRVLTRDSRHELDPGDTYAIPANIEHSIEIIEDAKEVQVFTRPSGAPRGRAASPWPAQGVRVRMIAANASISTAPPLALRPRSALWRQRRSSFRTAD